MPNFIFLLLKYVKNNIQSLHKKNHDYEGGQNL